MLGLLGRGTSVGGARLAAMLPALGLILAVTAESRAGEHAKIDRVGQRVVQKHREFTIRVEYQGAERKVALDIWRVEQADGPRLRIRAEKLGVFGCASAEQVIPLENAIAYFTDQIRDHPRDAFAYVMRASVWRDKKELDRALVDCDQAIRIDPRNAIAYDNRAAVWLEKKDCDRAIADFNTAIQLDPMNATAYSARAAIRYSKGEFDQAIQLDDRLVSPLICRAWIWTFCPDTNYRDGKKAVESATKACELTEWKDADNLGILAAAYGQTGDFVAAAKWRTRANALSSGIRKKILGKTLLWLYQRMEPLRDDAVTVTGGVR